MFKYHHICRTNSHRLCFHDNTYFCICELNHSRAGCFIHDPLLNHCDRCLSGGRCVKGHLKNSDNFICICPPCYRGHQCEFSMTAFGITLDSLLASEAMVVQIVYTALIFLLFAIGLFTNLCSFLTFKRAEPRKFTVGNFLFVVAILNQSALLSLLFKFVHVLLGTFGLTTDISCKIITFILSAITRSTYWLTSWITIIRLLITLYPVSIIIRNPRWALLVSYVTIFALFGMHVHEIVYYTVIRSSNSSVLLCVSNFNQNLAVKYNQVNTFLHYLVPFCIQTISITLLIIYVARSRARTVAKKSTFAQVLKEQFSTHKELYLTPAIIVLSALPQIILSFSLACTHLDVGQRHAIVVTYLLSYAPQVLGFILYVLPSSEYKKEFAKTFLGEKICKWLPQHKR